MTATMSAIKSHPGLQTYSASSSENINKNGSALKITANRPNGFTKFYSSGKRKKFKEITAQLQARTSRYSS